jgi:hypothetical protein
MLCWQSLAHRPVALAYRTRHSVSKCVSTPLVQYAYGGKNCGICVTCCLKNLPTATDTREDVLKTTVHAQPCRVAYGSAVKEHCHTANTRSLVFWESVLYEYTANTNMQSVHTTHSILLERPQLLEQNVLLAGGDTACRLSTCRRGAWSRGVYKGLLPGSNPLGYHFWEHLKGNGAP